MRSQYTISIMTVISIRLREQFLERAKTKQAKILRISRGSVYYLARPVSATDLEVMRRLDRLHLEFPFAGSRMLQGLLSADGCKSAVVMSKR